MCSVPNLVNFPGLRHSFLGQSLELANPGRASLMAWLGVASSKFWTENLMGKSWETQQPLCILILDPYPSAVCIFSCWRQKAHWIVTVIESSELICWIPARWHSDIGTAFQEWVPGMCDLNPEGSELVCFLQTRALVLYFLLQWY